MFEHLNLILFSTLNAEASLGGWQLLGAVFAAEWLIFLVPLTLVLLWTGGSGPRREIALRAFLAAVCALTLNNLIGHLWYSPRPFVAEIGHTFLLHAPDSSFPSDHATSIFSVALVLVFSGVAQVRRIGLVLLPLALVVAWSRVYLGVHWPKDMFGALVVSAAMAMLMSSAAGRAASAAVLPRVETLYRRVLALPIGRGWLRP
ncbi:phosphatase PAP2 family protein [Massilia sp. G4R7]|uniref:Phosphatase PAP2 family protein n=1 Tax=Massilia phyllostachyos TaxID=2898585 RepID=A0ABS8Q8T3_9BURK|nr:phosphatase PAP2 family protein [Massilia phyllostachyos]MCD2518004.1 phosphatase PAP2 family protein [Massilia phyllostachyos]